MNSVFSQKQQDITIQISDAEAAREKLKSELSQLEAELESASAQISIYQRLADVSQQLEELHDLGAGELFWQDKYTTEDELLEHVKGLQTKAKIFNDEIDIVRNKKLELEKKVERAGYEIAYLKEELEIEKEREADSKHDFVINRESTLR